MEQVIGGISTALLWTLGVAGLVAATSFVCGVFATALQKLKDRTPSAGSRGADCA